MELSSHLKRTVNSTEMDVAECIPKKVVLVERNIKPQGIQLVDPKAVNRRGTNDLIELAMEIEKADNFVKANTCGKLQVIAEQMRFLQQQAKRILLEARDDLTLHQAACNFVKTPGSIYHLYQKKISGQTYFSMLSPEEWGSSAPEQIYKGSFRLEHDRSWTPLSQVNIKDEELAIINKIYQSSSSSQNDSFSEYMSIDCGL